VISWIALSQDKASGRVIMNDYELCIRNTCNAAYITVLVYLISGGSAGNHPMGTRGSFPGDKAAWA
jgi:hypothetical protein